MSAELMGMVFYLDIEPLRKLVLLSLADNASDQGRCWPSQKLIGYKVGLSERSIRDHLHALEADGWLILLSQGNGRGNPNQYLLATDRIWNNGTQRKAELQAVPGNGLKAEELGDDDIKAELGVMPANSLKGAKAEAQTPKGANGDIKAEPIASAKPSVLEPSLRENHHYLKNPPISPLKGGLIYSSFGRKRESDRERYLRIASQRNGGTGT